MKGRFLGKFQGHVCGVHELRLVKKKEHEDRVLQEAMARIRDM